jgi:hypothetical protein
MTAKMVDALFMSYVAFVFIIVLDWLADCMEIARGGFEAVANSFILGLGVSWQEAFTEAVDSLTYKFTDPHVRAYMDCLMTLLLCFAILPAWLWFMMPKALAGPVPLEPLLPPKEEEKDTKGDGEAADHAEGGDEQVDVEMPGSEEITEEAEKEPAMVVSKGDLCAFCGTRFESPTALFCQNCGAKRGDSPTAAAPTVAAVPPPPPPPAPAPAPTATNQVVEPDNSELGATASMPSANMQSASSFGGKGEMQQRPNKSGGKAVEVGGKGSRGSIGKSQAAVASASGAQQTAPWDQQETWEQGDDQWGGGEQQQYDDDDADVAF